MARNFQVIAIGTSFALMGSVVLVVSSQQAPAKPEKFKEPLPFTIEQRDCEYLVKENSYVCADHIVPLIDGGPLKHIVAIYPVAEGHRPVTRPLIRGPTAGMSELL